MRGVFDGGEGLNVHAFGMLKGFVSKACGHEEELVVNGHVGDRHRKMPRAGWRHVLKMS